MGVKRTECVHCMDELPPECKNVLVYIERNAWRGNRVTRKKEIVIGWHIGGAWHVDGCSGVVGLMWMKLPKPPDMKTALKRGIEDAEILAADGKGTVESYGGRERQPEDEEPEGRRSAVAGGFVRGQRERR